MSEQQYERPNNDELLAEAERIQKMHKDAAKEEIALESELENQRIFDM